MKILQKFFHKAHRALLYLLYRFFETHKIDESLVVFFSIVDYSDNSRVLYDYLLKNRPQYHFVWLFRTDDIPNETSKTEFVRLFGSVRSVRLLATSKYIFHTHPLDNLFCPRKEQIVVNLWHGIPFKGIKGVQPPDIPPFNYVLCLGDNNIKTTAAFVGCDDSYVRPWGFPRIDLLFSARDEGKNNPFAPDGFDGKLIIWMPTFRKSLLAKHLSEEYCDNETGLPLMKTIADISKLNEFLQINNVAIIIKVHPLQAPKDSFKQKYSNILFINDEDIKAKGYQLYEIVAKTDALITDYSSISADYLVMNRPIGFILDDQAEYVKSRGDFMYNPITDVLGGSHIYTQLELMNFINEIAHGIDSTALFRQRVMRPMIKYPDGNNCKRIVDNLGM